jgi:signal transduction histidine kinase
MDGTMTKDARRVAMTEDEVELVRTALRLLLATLGKDEADEMREVERLLAKLEP